MSTLYVHGQAIIIIFARDRLQLCMYYMYVYRLVETKEPINQSPAVTILAMRSEWIALTYRHTLRVYATIGAHPVFITMGIFAVSIMPRDFMSLSYIHIFIILIFDNVQNLRHIYSCRIKSWTIFIMYLLTYFSLHFRYARNWYFTLENLCYETVIKKQRRNRLRNKLFG